MNGPSSDLAGLLDRCQNGIAAIFRQEATRSQRAGALADLLGQLAPPIAWSACSLRSEGAACLAIRPESDAGSEPKRLFQSQLSSFDSLTSEVRRLPSETLPGQQVLVSAIHDRERPQGFLAIGLPVETAAMEAARMEAFLTVAASTAALCGKLETARLERAEAARFARVGQAFAGLAHELNNALNSMMLQASMVQMSVHEQARQELAAIRQYGAQAAGLIRPLQHAVQERRDNSYLVDLNSMLTEVLEEEAELRRRVSPRYSERAPCFQGTRSAVKQLVRLLLEGACAGAETMVTAATGAREGGAALSLTFAVPPPDLGADGELSLVELLIWQNLDEVGRQAGQSLLRQLGGAVTMERLGDGALILHIVWEQSA